MDSLVRMDQPVPDFMLPDHAGMEHTLRAARGKIVVLMSWSAECPWSKRADALVQSWRPDWGEDVVLWMLASNANEGLDMTRKVAEERGIETVLIDQNHCIADLFGAMTTPQCFVIDGDGQLRYRGAIDDTTFRQREATRYYLKDAVAAIREGRQPNPADTPSYGCTIVRVSVT